MRLNFLKNKRIYDTILISWPNYKSNFAYKILENMTKGQTLIFIGEGYGGCTVNDIFFNKLYECAELIEDKTIKLREGTFSWYGIYDKVSVCKIK